MLVKDSCFYCNTAFRPTERRVPFEGKELHETCEKRRKSNARLREFFRQDRGQVGLVITPHGIHLRRG